MVTVPNNTSSGYSGLQTGATALMAFGITEQAVNAYYGVLSSRYEAKAKASEMEYEGTIAAINARQGESDAQLELLAGEQEIGRVGLQYGQLMGQQRISQGASGTVAGFGSNASALAGVDLAKQIDMITIDANSTRAANSSRMRSVDQRNRGRMAMVSAGNLRSMGRAASPELAAGTSLISGAGQIAGQWAAQEERSAYYRSRGAS